MQSFKTFIVEEAKSSFGVKLKGEHIGDDWHHHGNGIYTHIQSKGYKTSAGTAKERVLVHHDYTKDHDRQKGKYRDVHMPEKEIGHVELTREKGKPPKIVSHVVDKSKGAFGGTHEKEHKTFNQAFKHILNSRKEMEKRANKRGEDHAAMHSYRNFSQDGNRR